MKSIVSLQMYADKKSRFSLSSLPWQFLSTTEGLLERQESLDDKKCSTV